MTFFEKQHLWKMVKDMPRKNFDRVVEIIRHGKGLDRDEPKDIFVDLEDMVSSQICIALSNENHNP